MQDNVCFIRIYRPILIDVYLFICAYVCMGRRLIQTECIPACEHWRPRGGAEWQITISFPFMHLCTDCFTCIPTSTNLFCNKKNLMKNLKSI